uniref:Apple domain-containing protein n=1 Tax=Ditylenchus dipsaci TaxID=166011 RepID=A0A915DDB3_9BILA
MNFEPTRCTDSNRTVYLRTEAVIVEEPAAVTLIDLSLNECAKKCTGNIDGIDCRSFEYNSDKQSCALKESNGQVFATDNLSSCLLKCLESRKRMHMDCRSVMYFYESGQCILNREHQKTVPTNMFSNETHFQLVDYFENNCFDSGHIY